MSPFPWVRGGLQSDLGFGRVLQDKLLGDEAGTLGRDFLACFPALLQSHSSDLKGNELVLNWKEWLCPCISV